MGKSLEEVATLEADPGKKSDSDPSPPEQPVVDTTPLFMLQQLREFPGGSRIMLSTKETYAAVMGVLRHPTNAMALETVSRPSTRDDSANLSSEIAAAFAAVMGKLEPKDPRYYAASMVIEEAIQNASRDGNHHNRYKNVFATYGVLSQRPYPEFILMVSDEGPGFILDQVPNCLHESRLGEPNGRGLLLINDMLSKFERAEQAVGRATYYPMDGEKVLTNRLFIEMPVIDRASEEMKARFQAWIQAGKPATKVE